MKAIYKIITSLIAIAMALNATAQLVTPINFSLPGNISSANVSAAEWYFDKDPGLGSGTNIPITAGNDITVNNFSIAIDTLSTGVHPIYVRVKNTNGVWSLSNEANFFIIPQGAIFPASTAIANITAAEWFVDNDPGMGQGTSITITAGTNVVANNIAIPIDTLSTGVHHLYLRVKNTNGAWSITNTSIFYIVQGAVLFPANASAANVSAAEYFLDNDPGLGNGTNIPITSGSAITANNIAINISSLAVGAHHIYVRTKNANNVWSITNVAAFYIVPINFNIPPNAAMGNITALEYFFDTDPGFGNGTMVTVSPTTDLSNYQIVADISNLQQDTAHTLYVRALDGWSQTTATTFIIGTPLAQSWLRFSGKRLDNNSVLLNWTINIQQGAKFFLVEHAINGKDFSNIAKITALNHAQQSPESYHFTDTHPIEGNNYYRIEQIDLNGKSSFSSIIIINTANRNTKDFYVINNPVLNILHVFCSTKEINQSIQIFDINGRLLLSKHIENAGIQNIDLSLFTKGIYLIRLIGKNDMFSKKILKE